MRVAGGLLAAGWVACLAGACLVPVLWPRAAAAANPAPMQQAAAVHSAPIHHGTWSNLLPVEHVGSSSQQAGSMRAAGSAGGQASASATVSITLTVEAPGSGPPPPDNNGSNGPFGLAPLLAVTSEGTPGTPVSQGLRLSSSSGKPLTFAASVESPILDVSCAPELSCAPWSQVAPAATTLAPMASRPLTLKYTIPPSLATTAFFFGRIDVAATDSAGAPAGSLQRFVVIHNKNVSVCSKLDYEGLTCGSDGSYATVRVSCVNGGNACLTLSPTGCLRDPKGKEPAHTIPLKCAPVQLLPQAQLSLSGSLALAGVADGDYQLEVGCDYDRGSLELSAPARVSTAGGKHNLELTGGVNKVQVSR